MGHAGEISRQKSAGIQLLLVDLERLHDACSPVVEHIVVAVRLLDVLFPLSLRRAVVFRPFLFLFPFFPALSPRRLVEGGSFLPKLLQFPPLAVQFKAELEQRHGSPLHVQIEVQLQSVRLSRPAVGALDLVFQVALGKGQIRVRIDGHLLGAGVVAAELAYPVHDEVLADFHGHQHGLSLENVLLHVLQGIVSPVREQRDVPESSLPEILQDDVQTPGIRHVSGKGAVVDRHVAGKRVDHDGKDLLQGKMLLVLPPVNVGQGIAVDASAGGVDGAKFVLSEARGPQGEKLHPLLLRNGLRQFRNGLRGKGKVARRLDVALPALHGAEAEFRQIGEHRQGHDGVHHLLVPLEHHLKVPADHRLLRNLLQKPDVAVQAVLRIAVKNGAPAAPPVGQLVQQAQIPHGRKDELRPLRTRKGQELGPGRELVPLQIILLYSVNSIRKIRTMDTTNSQTVDNHVCIDESYSGNWLSLDDFSANFSYAAFAYPSMSEQLIYDCISELFDYIRYELKANEIIHNSINEIKYAQVKRLPQNVKNIIGMGISDLCNKFSCTIFGFYSTFEGLINCMIRNDAAYEYKSTIEVDQIVKNKFREILFNEKEKGKCDANLFKYLYIPFTMTIEVWHNLHHKSFSIKYDSRNQKEDKILFRNYSWISKAFQSTYFKTSTDVDCEYLNSKDDYGIMLADILAGDLRKLFINHSFLSTDLSSSKIITNNTISKGKSSPYMLRESKTNFLKEISEDKTLITPYFINCFGNDQISCLSKYGECRKIDFRRNCFWDMVD